MNTTSLYYAFLRSALVERLNQEQAVTLEFIKKDKSVRKMEATLNNTYIEENVKDDRRKAAESLLPLNLNLVNVVDVEKNEWRSFNLSTLLSFDGILVKDWVGLFISQFPPHKQDEES